MRLKVPSVLLRNNSCNLTLGRGKQGCAEVAGVTFSDSNSAPVPKFFNPGPEIFQNWESDSGYYRCNPGSPLFLLQKWPRRLLLLPKLKSDSGTVFSRIFDFGFGSERKTQNPAGVDDSGSVATSAVSSLLLALREPVFPLQNSALSKCLFQWARNHADTTSESVKGLCDIKFGILQVRAAKVFSPETCDKRLHKHESMAKEIKRNNTPSNRDDDLTYATPSPEDSSESSKRE